MQDAFGQLRAQAQRELRGDGLQVGFTGGVASELDSARATETLSMVEGLLLMGAIVVLNLIFFRGLLAAFVPLLAVTLVGGAAVGLIGVGAWLLDLKVDAGTPSLIPAVLIGIGVDYFLFLIFRMREQLRTGAARKPAAAAAARSVGEVIASAALAVIAAFATLGLAQFGQFQVLGPAIAISVAVMLLAGLTLMPALLAICGRGLFWPSKAWLAPREAGFATRLGERIAGAPRCRRARLRRRARRLRGDRADGEEQLRPRQRPRRHAGGAGRGAHLRRALRRRDRSADGARARRRRRAAHRRRAGAAAGAAESGPRRRLGRRAAAVAVTAARRSSRSC